MRKDKRPGSKLHRPLEPGIKMGATGTGPQTYSDFLQLDTLLSRQSMLSDPTLRYGVLLIVIHQVSVLWLKLMHHEVSEARREIAGEQLPQALKHFTRVKSIQEQLIADWKVLNTMTPVDYLAFRQL